MSGTVRIKRRASVVLLGVSIASLATACTNTNNNAVIDPRLPIVFDGGAAVVDGPRSRTDLTGDASPLFDPGYLWFAGGGLSAFTRTATSSSQDRGPAFVVVPAPTASGYHDLAFDRDGNLWTIPIGSDRIERIAASGLGPFAPPPAPDRVITSAALARPQSLAFDGSGNLWVLNYDGAGPSVANIVRFDAPFDDGDAGDRTPSATLNPSAADRAIFNQGASIAFDASGDLWFSAITSVARVAGAPGAQGTATATLAAVIGSGDSVFVSLAFDSTGALWITGASAGYFVSRIDDARSLATPADAAPSALLRLPSDGSSFAGGMAFDDQGTLWIAMSNRIVALGAPGTAQGTLSVTPAITLGLSNPPDLATRLAFWPRPPGVPVY